MEDGGVYQRGWIVLVAGLQGHGGRKGERGVP
jgi:hypothetical protein